MKYERLTPSLSTPVEDEMALGVDYYGGNYIDENGKVKTRIVELRFREVYNRLLELEDKIDDGLLVEFPIAIGKKIFVLAFGKVLQGEITETTVNETEVKSYVEFRCNDLFHGSLIDSKEIGKTVFLTKAEAEAKLKELRGEE